MKEIAAAMVNAQKNFAPALKTNTNPHFKSKYADLSACVEAVIDALNDAGIALIQRCHECDDGVIVETVFLHSSGESIESGRLHVPAVKSDPQGYGSALTYARRYSLMAACGIAPEDDDGNSASRDRKPGKPVLITESQAADLDALLEEVGGDKKAFMGYFKIASLRELPAGEYGKAVAMVNAKRDKKPKAAA
ncbi:MAG: ERF family protein [Firmicutes bacterium]|nr:ERF family protein [Bacillota bacterium]